MGFYDDKVLPFWLDLAMRQKPIRKQREKVVPRAAGRVLEIGMGSGLNLAFYDKGRLEKLYGLEPHEKLRARAADRAREAGVDVEFVGLVGEEIPLDDASVDDVVVTYTLCTIPDVDRALCEMRRVLRPGGRLLFSEHGLAPDASVERWQHRLNGVWRRVAGGCNMNRRIDRLIEAAEFVDLELESMYVPGPRVLTFTYWGSARR